MKKISYLLSTALLALLLNSCDNGASSDSKEIADSTNKARAERSDSTGTPVIAVAPEDADFAVKAADGGMTEVELGMLADGKATDTAVKGFASMMVKDHTKINDELKAIAQRKNIALPAAISDDHQKMKDNLSKKTGKDFDKAYVNDMVDGHKKTVKMFEDAQDKVKDPDLKSFIMNTLPTLKMHLEHIQNIDKRK